jgi:hypothetical protein
VLRYAEFEGVDPVEYEDDHLVGASRDPVRRCDRLGRGRREYRGGMVDGHGENVSEADISAMAEAGSNGKDRGMTSTETFENLDPLGRRRDRAI